MSAACCKKGFGSNSVLITVKHRQRICRLGVDILEGFISLDSESQARNISAWTPVVAEVLQGICSWDDSVLQEHVAVLYPLSVDLLAREMSSEVRESVRSGWLLLFGIIHVRSC